MNLLEEYEITQGYSQPAAGQFSVWKSFMFITNANQWCLLASLLTASSASDFTITIEKKKKRLENMSNNLCWCYVV